MLTVGTDPNNQKALTITSAQRFKSNNKSNTWTALSASPGTLEQRSWHQFIAVDPQNDDHIFVNDAYSLWESTDGGVTWVQPKGNLGYDWTGVSFDINGSILACADQGLFRYRPTTKAWESLIGNLQIATFYTITVDSQTLCGTAQDQYAAVISDRNQNSSLWQYLQAGGETGKVLLPPFYWAGSWDRHAQDVFTAADVDGDGEVEIVATDNGDGWTGVLKWQGGALVPVWMSPSPLAGPEGNWDRHAQDVFTAADVDGDGEVEIVATDNGDGWTGVLKWQGGALVPVWMSPSPLAGPAGNWDRHAQDVFTAADVDGDGEVEIVATDNGDGWTGVLKWQGGALVPVWMSPSPLTGPAGNWDRHAQDVFTAVDVDGDGEVEIVATDNGDGWTGVLKWQGGALVPVWMSPSPLAGPAGNWKRHAQDVFIAADVDGDGEVEIVATDNGDGWTGVLKWQGGALVPVWMNPSPLAGPAGNWDRHAQDVFTAADVDGDGEVEIVATDNGDGWTGVLKCRAAPWCRYG